jgi:hypothetical protein
MRPSNHAVARPNGASSSAEYSRKSASVWAKIADAQMNTPVSTGYSTTPPIGWPSSASLPWT